MTQIKTLPMFDSLDRLELRLCLLLNRSCHNHFVRKFFALISRLGDGLFWYSLMFILPLVAGQAGLFATLHIFVVGAFGKAVYHLLKPHLVRERPFFTHPGILLGTAPLDKLSFPSGHTLQAVGTSLVMVFHFPVLAWLVYPFTMLIALSRVVLGLHYPSDVLAGAAIGASLALLSFALL